MNCDVGWFANATSWPDIDIVARQNGFSVEFPLEARRLGVANVSVLGVVVLNKHSDGTWSPRFVPSQP